MPKLLNALDEFSKEYNLKEKGALCVGLVITRQARDMDFPLQSDALLSPRGGQVKGLGKASVQSILKDYGLKRVLAQEGGRTSRGSIDNMRKYVAFLNHLHSHEILDLEFLEQWWVERVKAFFAAKPFVLKYESGKSLRAVLQDLLCQAQERQQDGSGTTYTGILLQHLVGAKLSILLDNPIEMHGASVADEPSDRPGDFIINDVSIHVTTSPGESLIEKCISNIDAGLRPVLITLGKGVATADGLAEQAGVADRLDIFEAEQFLAGNLYELGKFAETGQRDTADAIVRKYNEIIDKYETDPGLKIKIAK